MHPTRAVVEGGPILSGGKPLLVEMLGDVVRVEESVLEGEKVERGREEDLQSTEGVMEEDERPRHENDERVVRALCISSLRKAGGARREMLVVCHSGTTTPAKLIVFTASTMNCARSSRASPAPACCQGLATP
eukprot:Phypoly_transcript_16023.p1 GENE.Phypoly_transcript_16023~~Phypoly_transcript_16023.p1  ORF type:complete len:133 (-),score=27.05 Phypoly_transcript_16023:353-751(-)